jgi:multicomponent Na+:H+ antiporter subunit B
VKSLILRTAARLILPLLLLYSIFLLLRGHNEPGGGFAAGLVAASAFALYALAFNVESANRALQIRPDTLIAIGLLVAAASGLLGLVRGESFMKGLWTALPLPVEVRLYVGTPLVFDMGVYLVVIGVTTMIVLNLAEE